MLCMREFIHTLTKNKVVWPEDLPKGSRSYGVHSARLQVD